MRRRKEAPVLTALLSDLRDLAERPLPTRRKAGDLQILRIAEAELDGLRAVAREARKTDADPATGNLTRALARLDAASSGDGRRGGPRSTQKRSAEASIEQGSIVIRLPVVNIPKAYRAGVDLGCIPTDGWKVTNAVAFARDVVRALNDEDEQGTTPIHRLFDAAFSSAVEQGSEGAAEVEDAEDSP